MPVAIQMPNQQQKADPLEKLSNALNIARQGFGIYTDISSLNAAKEQRKVENARADKDDARKERAFILGPGDEERAGLEKSKLRAETRELEARAKNKGVTDPLTAELRQQRLDDAKRKNEEAAFKKTPRGKLEAMHGDQRGRYDNVTMALGALTGMEGAHGAGDNTFSLIGDNDFTRNRTKWEEAIGRMQSGGAISNEEAERFRSLIPGVRDSKDQQVKKLADMRAEMESRFNTMGFQQADAENLGIDPKRMGWAPAPTQQAATPGGFTVGGQTVAPNDVAKQAAEILAQRQAQVRK